ncbi:MAG: lipoprotein [Solirubrobacterales bacterium]|nr:lipoprotein [Solirubrobacterales bacterium]
MKKLVILAVILGLAVAGCGSGGSSESPQETSEAATGGAVPTETKSGGVPSEAESLATGDIPDNQEFLTYTDQPAGYSIKYPAGWARTGNGNDVTFREKGNVVHISVHPGKAKSGSGEKKTLTRQSAPDPVTGKSLPLLVDIYEYEKGGKVAVLELSTPEGVDNVDAYRMISESFEWR